MIKKTALSIVGIIMTITSAFAAIKGETIEYSINGTTMEGYIVYDDANAAPKPGILIAHDWMGLGQFTKDKANQLAQLGYVAFALDIYGKGIHPKDEKEAAKKATQYKEDPALLRSHMQAALDKFKTLKQVDPSKIVAIGYCFGGTAVLELARSGAPLVGTATFHGGLATKTPEDAKNIKGRVLVMHGADDPNVPPRQVQAFKDEMKNAGVNMTFIAYPGAVHGFTNPSAGNDNSKGVAYSAQADKQSWIEFQTFLKEVLN